MQFMGNNENQDSFEADQLKEKEFEESLRKHVEKSFDNGSLSTLPNHDGGISPIYLMRVHTITRWEMLGLGKFHVTVEMITTAIAPHTLLITLKRI